MLLVIRLGEFLSKMIFSILRNTVAKMAKESGLEMKIKQQKNIRSKTPSGLTTGHLKYYVIQRQECKRENTSTDIFPGRWIECGGLFTWPP